MLNNIFGNIIRFVIVLFVQVLLLNNIQFTTMFHPYIYPLIILLLPVESPRWLQLILGFTVGLIVDMFMHTIGIHAAATLLLAFLRQPMINALKPADGYQPGDKPRIAHMGFMWFVTYCSVLIFIHHFVVFIIETLSVTQLLSVLGRIVTSSLVSVAIIVILEYLFYKPKRVLI